MFPSFFLWDKHMIKSSNWTQGLIDSQLSCKVWSSFKIYFLSNKHKQERQSCVCVVLNIAWFISQCKPRAFLCRRTLSLVKGWDVCCFYFPYYDKLSLRQHFLGNIALISGMAESRPWRNIYKGFSCSLARGFSRPLTKYFCGNITFSCVHRPNQVYRLDLGSSRLSITMQGWVLFDKFIFVK